MNHIRCLSVSGSACIRKSESNYKRQNRALDLDELAEQLHSRRMAKVLTEENFDAEVLNSDKPVLVDFWAEWCGPCKMISPLIDELSDEVGDAAVVGKVEVDNAQALAAKFGVRSIPFLLFFKDGEVKDQIVGANVNKEDLKAKLLAL